MEPVETGGVELYVRVRPPSRGEGQGAVLVGKDRRTLYLKLASGGYRPFNFDRIFGVNSSNGEIFTSIGMPLVERFLSGTNCAILAFGQSGSGKTHTLGLLGKIGPHSDGLLPFTLRVLFNKLSGNKSVSLAISLVQVYKDDAYDLLRPQVVPLTIREDPNTRAFFLPGLVIVPLESEMQACELLCEGLQRRPIASQALNPTSSRSHLLLTVYLKRKESGGDAALARFTFADLAGGERVSKSESKGLRLEEARAINSSLSALAESLSKLRNDKPEPGHFRNGKLSKLLQSSLIGGAKVAVLGAVRTDLDFTSETGTTLSFLMKCKQIKLSEPTTAPIEIEEEYRHEEPTYEDNESESMLIDETERSPQSLSKEFLEYSRFLGHCLLSLSKLLTKGEQKGEGLDISYSQVREDLPKALCSASSLNEVVLEVQAAFRILVEQVQCFRTKLSESCKSSKIRSKDQDVQCDLQSEKKGQFSRGVQAFWGGRCVGVQAEDGITAKKLEILMISNKKLQSDCENFKKERAAMQQNQEHLRLELSETQQKLEGANNKAVQASEGASKLAKQVEVIKSNYNHLTEQTKNAVAQTEREAADLKIQVAELQAQLSAERNSKEKLRNEFEEHISHLNCDWETKYSELRLNMKGELSTELDSLRQKNSALEAKLNQATQEIDLKKTELSVLKEEMHNFETIQADYKELINKEKVLVLSKDSELETLKEEIDSLKIIEEDLKSLLEQERARIEQQTQSKSELEEELARDKENIKQLEADNLGLMQQLQAEKRKSEMETDLRLKIEADARKGKDSVGEAVYRIRDLERECLALKETKKELIARIDGYEQERVGLEESKANSKKTEETWKEEVSTLKHNFELKVTEINNQLESWKKKYNQLEEKYTREKEEFKREEKELANIEKKLKETTNVTDSIAAAKNLLEETLRHERELAEEVLQKQRQNAAKELELERQKVADLMSDRSKVLSDLKIEREAHQEKIEQVKSTFRAELESAQNKVVSVEERNSELENQIYLEKKKANETVSVFKHQCEEKMKLVQEELERLKNDRDKWKADIKKQREEYEVEIQAMKNDTNQESSHLSDQLRQMRAQLQQAQNELRSEKEEHSYKFEKKNAELEEVKNTFGAQVRSLEERNEELSNSLKQQKQDRELVLTKQMEELRVINEKLKNRLEECEMERDKLTNYLKEERNRSENEAKKASEEFKAHLADLEEKIESLEEAKLEMTETLKRERLMTQEALTNQREEAEVVNKVEHEKLKGVEKERSALDKECRMLETRLVESEHKRASLETHVTSLFQANKALSLKVQELSQKFKHLQNTTSRHTNPSELGLPPMKSSPTQTITGHDLSSQFERMSQHKENLDPNLPKGVPSKGMKSSNSLNGLHTLPDPSKDLLDAQKDELKNYSSRYSRQSRNSKRSPTPSKYQYDHNGANIT